MIMIWKHGFSYVVGLCLLLPVAVAGCSTGTALGSTGTALGSTGTASDSTGSTDSLSLTAPSLQSTAVNSALSSATLQVSGGTAPYTWSVKSGTLPEGITLSSSGVLSGIPGAIGAANVTVSVSDSSKTVLTATEQVSFDIIPAGFTPNNMVLDEEFNESTLNTALWRYRPGVRDQCTQDPSAVTVANGYIRLSTYTTTSGGVSTNYCGAIDTSTAFTHAYGYWEAAVRYQYQPVGQCSWWIQSPTNGQNLSNPQASGTEFDVFEHTAWTSSATGYDHALHWDGYATGTAQSLGYNGTLAALNDGNFHIFGIAWTPSGYTFYVDGNITWTVSSSTAPVSSAAEYIILDNELPIATGIPTAGYGALGSSSNQHLDVDYVRVYAYTPGS